MSAMAGASPGGTRLDADGPLRCALRAVLSTRHTAGCDPVGVDDDHGQSNFTPTGMECGYSTPFGAIRNGL